MLIQYGDRRQRDALITLTIAADALYYPADQIRADFSGKWRYRR